MKVSILRFDIKNSRNYNSENLYKIFSNLITHLDEMFFDVMLTKVQPGFGDEALLVFKKNKDALKVRDLIINYFKKQNILIKTVIVEGFIKRSDLYINHNNIRIKNIFIISFLLLNNIPGKHGKNGKYYEYIKDYNLIDWDFFKDKLKEQHKVYFFNEKNELIKRK